MLVKLITLQSPDRDEPLETLTLGRSYEVLAWTGDWYCLLDDDDEPYLYVAGCFEVIDPSEPDFWVEEWFYGERYASPPEWAKRGFWEHFDDDDPAAGRAFWTTLRRRYPWTWQERGFWTWQDRGFDE
ncbi:hypothetical protein [Nannocystis punicea]|uniref:Uncharacterized protein n=1 Tax=Nannocystis punicea TaxID=2995304 RepID=A0ABY7H2L3_9BACT|nr:hypothetical protein [Nannocystis poenicansa]WAS93477.1 hypothetical protein O0S08_45665 [Nannocystis poenicansa]